MDKQLFDVLIEKDNSEQVKTYRGLYCHLPGGGGGGAVGMSKDTREV